VNATWVNDYLQILGVMVVIGPAIVFATRKLYGQSVMWRLTTFMCVMLNVGVLIGYTVGRIGLTAIVLAAGAVAAAGLAIGILLLMEWLIVRPMKAMTKVAAAAAQGVMDCTVVASSSDEVGRLAVALAGLMRALQEKARLAAAVAAGDLTQEVSLLSEKDTLGQAMYDMTANLRNMVQQMCRRPRWLEVRGRTVWLWRKRLSRWRADGELVWRTGRARWRRGDKGRDAWQWGGGLERRGMPLCLVGGLE